jgi:prepilin-type N-terminal cleavage/methylation domain-containing protein
MQYDENIDVAGGNCHSATLIRMQSRLCSTSGFTLVELMVVIALIGALLSIAAPQLATYLEQGRKAKCLSNRYNIEQDERTYYLSNNSPSLAIDSRYQCVSGGTYAWLVSDPTAPDYPRIGCSLHYGSIPDQAKKDYTIDLSSKALSNTTKEVYVSFADYVSDWMLKGNKMPIVNYTNGSLSWSSALYTGTDKTNLLQAKFWTDYYQFVDEKDFNATNSQISDFKVFFKRDANGNVTSDVAGVYLQIGGDRRIYFSNGGMIANQHYSNYIDTKARELRPPQ